jgi:hypothetical protein
VSGVVANSTPLSGPAGRSEATDGERRPAGGCCSAKRPTLSRGMDAAYRRTAKGRLPPACLLTDRQDAGEALDGRLGWVVALYA